MFKTSELSFLDRVVTDKGLKSDMKKVEAITRMPNPVAPLLVYYDPTKELTIQCGVSSTGLDSALMQEGKPLAYSTNTLLVEKQWSLSPCGTNVFIVL